jgi:hypothetical protein
MGNALMSLLAPVVSAGQVKGADDPGAVPAFLAFANRMAQAGAPTLGPPQGLINAFPQAMTAGYSAARQAETLPLLYGQAQLETARQQESLAKDAFELDRERTLWGLTKDALTPGNIGIYTGTAPPPGAEGGATPAGPGGEGGGGASVAPVQSSPLAEVPATADVLASLPDVQRLPAQARQVAIAAMTKVGMGPAEAAQYARMLMQESAGQHIDPKTGKILTSSKGALGLAQVMPDTFASMQKAYNIAGGADDPLSNVLAGAHYFHEGVQQSGIHNATVRYSAGPGGLQKYIQGQGLPDETRDYLAKTGAPGGPVMTAGPGAPTVPMPATSSGLPPGGGGTNAQPMVIDPVSKQMVPAGVLSSAQAAARAAIAQGKPMEMQGAYNAEIAKYQQERAAAGSVVPIGPGLQRNTVTGQVSQIPDSPTVASPLTEDEYKKFAPNRIPGMDYIGQRYVGGPLDGQVKSVEVTAPRSAGLPFQQAMDINTDLNRQPAMTNWQQAQSRYDLLMQALNQKTRAGDEGAIQALGKIFDPSAVVHEGRIHMAEQFGGWAQRLQEFLGTISGESGMPDSVRQQVAQLGNEEMRARDLAALQQVQQHRDLATANGVDPHKIMPSFTTASLGGEEAGRYGGMPGVTFQPAYQWDPGKGRMVREEAKPVPAAQPARVQPPAALPQGAPPPTPPGGATAAPGGGATVAAPQPGTAPATPTAPATATPAAPGTNKLTPLALGPMSAAGLAKLAQDMKAHPDRYTDADRATFVSHMTGRGR